VLILIIPIAVKPSNNTLERCVRVKGYDKEEEEKKKRNNGDGS
jgi:hypothetical protein